MKLRWSQLGGQLGVGLGLLGFVLLFLGWNGAASYDRVPAQFPYLISGGLAGLALVVFGAALVIVQNARADRAALQQTVAELRVAVEKMAAAASAPALAASGEAAGLVVAGPSSYHRPSCRLLEGRRGLPTMTATQAEEQGLSPCRTCDAADLTLPVSEPGEPLPARRRRGARTPSSS
jgi:uncharacterized membrane protein